jgi:two-component system chemotaxis sensor kinase CheA
MALEAAGAHPDGNRIDSAFRAVHSLKGAVALFDFAAMGTALHAAEDVLGAMRERRLPAARNVIDALLACIGASEDWIASIARIGGLPVSAEAEGQRLRDTLLALLGAPARPAPEAAADTSWLGPLRDRATARDAPAAARATAALRYTPNADCFFHGIDPLALARAIPDLLHLEIESAAPADLAAFDPFVCTLRLMALSAAPVDAVRAVFRLSADQVVVAPVAGTVVAPTDSLSEDPTRETPKSESAGRSLRVDAGRIDAMADIVGELIVAKNALAHLATRAAAFDTSLARALAANQAEIDRLTGAMHRAVISVRMITLARTFQRLPRIVRETASRLGREVVFDVTGGDVQADKSIVDGLFEPLMHVLRNAVDHGIETQAARRAAGKPEAGHIVLAASRAGDQIVITVSDDGAGIDTARVRQVAKTRGIMDPAAIDALDDRDAAALIFAPGFSTAASITEISGRGVGMDVVRSSVEGLGGRVSVETTPGHGSTVRMALPQAAMVTTVMTVRAGGEQFGVPIEVIAETARVAADRIVPVHNGDAFVLRDRTVPMLHLAALLGLPADPCGDAGDTRVLVVAAGAHYVGVQVDGFTGRSDVLVRPMTGLLAGLRGVLGHALMGDGNVLMVLDLPELIG